MAVNSTQRSNAAHQMPTPSTSEVLMSSHTPRPGSIRSVPSRSTRPSLSSFWLLWASTRRSSNIFLCLSSVSLLAAIVRMSAGFREPLTIRTESCSAATRS